MQDLPCRGREGFTNPAVATVKDIIICDNCPIRRKCAERALTIGLPLDRTGSGVADGVIAAGVVCHGDEETAIRLAAVAGHPDPPTRQRVRQEPILPGTRCRCCHRPMVPRPRGDDIHLGEGIVTHCARGLCRVCYQRAKRSGQIETTPQSARDVLERTA